LQGAVGEVEPEEIVGVVRVGWGQGETTITVAVNDVFDYRRGFGKGDGWFL
jgi:hypothetical protein